MRLALTRCDLADTPASLWMLPSLRWLVFDGNWIVGLPSQIGLPARTSINLAHSAFRTLPEALFALLKLESLSLDDNPLALLPDAANASGFSTALDIASKRRLLDFEYRGRDGATDVIWDDEACYARSTTEVAAVVDALHNVSPKASAHAGALRFLAKRGVAIVLGGAEDYSQVGIHRVSGMPDLPLTLPCPRFECDGAAKPYEFLCRSTAPN